jgi:hypothetical protein
MKSNAENAGFTGSVILSFKGVGTGAIRGIKGILDFHRKSTVGSS